MPEQKLRIAVLVTCFNRVNTTLRCLGLLIDGVAMVDDVAMKIFLVDDASPDGTGAKVRERFPEVHVIDGTGGLFWNGGMCRAYAETVDEPFDAFLMFNDDTAVEPSLIGPFLEDYRQLNATQPTILVAPMASAVTGAPTYGGYRRRHPLRPMNLERVPPTGRIETIDSFNGNFVLIPGKFMRDIGGMDPRYFHSTGDIDLSMMAKRHGVMMALWSRPLGICELNPPIQKSLQGKSFTGRLKYLFTGKMTVMDYFRFCWKHMPKYLFPLYAASHCTRLFLIAARTK